MAALLRRLLRLERRLLSRPAPPAEPGPWLGTTTVVPSRATRPAEAAATVCERCGMLVDTACWHRNCPLTRSHPR